MNIARGIVSWISLYLVGIFFVLTASMYALFGTINADIIAKTLQEENTYSKIVPAVLSSAEKDTTGSIHQLPLQSPWVRSAAETAFPPSDLQQKSEVAINSTFAWLEGKTSKPEFTIDFSQNKQRFSEELGKNLEQQLSSLPPCGLSNIPTSVNVYTATCLPPGVSPGQVKSVVSQQIATDTSFLKDPIFSSDDLTKEKSTLEGVGAPAVIKENPLTGLDGLRGLFENKNLLLWLLPIITVALVVMGVLLATSREKALRRLTRSFFFSAIGLLAVGLVLGYVVDQLGALETTDAVANDLLRPVFLNLTTQLATYFFISAGIGLLMAIVLFAGRRQMKQHTF